MCHRTCFGTQNGIHINAIVTKAYIRRKKKNVFISICCFNYNLYGDFFFFSLTKHNNSHGIRFDSGLRTMQQTQAKRVKSAIVFYTQQQRPNSSEMHREPFFFFACTMHLLFVYFAEWRQTPSKVYHENEKLCHRRQIDERERWMMCCRHMCFGYFCMTIKIII